MQGAQSECKLHAQLAAAERNVSGVEVRIRKCEEARYRRQARYWKLRRKLWVEQKERLTLKRDIVGAERSGKQVPGEWRRRLSGLEAAARARQPQAAADRQALRLWQQVDRDQHALDEPYGWHQVRLALLRDLIQRCRRIEFYLYEAPPTDANASSETPVSDNERQHRHRRLRASVETPATGNGEGSGSARRSDRLRDGLEALLADGRQWEHAYGELFFGRREQRLLGQFAGASQSLRQAEALSESFAGLVERRERLVRDVLDYLATFDRDGKFASLDIPTPRPIELDASGRPSDLIYCGDGGGGTVGAALHANRKPLCFDVLDFRFRVPPFAGPGQVDLSNRALRRRRETARTDEASGHVFKQPVQVITHSRTPTLVDPKLLSETPQDQGPFLRSYDGLNGSYPNIWHSDIRQLARKNLKAWGQFCRENVPRLLFYDKLAWEPAFEAHRDGVTMRLAGYNPEAVAAFRQYLRKKFGSVSTLNGEWRTHYQSFDAIDPPHDPFVVPRTWATPLTHEFERFRVEAYGDWLAWCCQCLREGDPARPISVEIRVINSHFSWAMADPFELMKRVPAEYIEDHYNNWPGAYPGLNMLYSLCLYAGKHPVEMEYIWTFPRLEPPQTEEQFRVTGELGFWRRVVWGRKALHVFGWFDGWGYRHNYMDERFCELGATLGRTGHFIREAATCLPVSKKRAREFWPILNTTEIVKPALAVLLPTTTMLNQHPYRSPYRGYGASITEIIRLERMFLPRDLDYRVVPEAVVLSGEEDLSDFRVLVLPYAPYLPQGLSDILLAWTRRGGLLIFAGPAGGFNEYGFPDGALLKALFGPTLTADYAGSPRAWRWKLSDVSTRASAAVRHRNSRGAVLLATELGDGAALLLAQSVADADATDSARLVMERIEQAVGWPTARAQGHPFEMVTRVDARGRRYLFVTNPSLSRIASGAITVDGEYTAVADLGIGTHCRVPLAPRQNQRATPSSWISPNGRTTFQLRLEPGEATVLLLARGDDSSGFGQ